MPALSMFFGLIIRMYYGSKKHRPLHIHIEYQGKDTVVDIPDRSVIEGSLSLRHFRFIQAWIEIHREELFANLYPYSQKIDRHTHE